MNDASEKPNDILVIDQPLSEDEVRSSQFAKLMAKARALKPGDDAGVQDLMYEAARKNLTDLQGEMLIEAINTSTGFKLGVLRKTWAKKRKEAQEEAAAAAASGAGSAGWGPAGASSNASYAGAFGQYCLDEYGLFWRNPSKVWVKIASPFEILGRSRDTEKDDWGKLARFKNEDGNVCEEVVTEETLRRDPNGVASWLTRRGMWISGISAEQRAFLEYLMLESHIDERVTRTRSTGWIKIGGERAFVLPGETIGASGSERIILDQHAGASYAQRGTLDEWRDNIAKAAGDHLMMRLSISTSLGGPLLYLGGFESGLMHYQGFSGKGTTTMLRVAASSWGSGADDGYMRSWRTTANALEGTLASMSDTLLVLDELAQANSHEVGKVVYMIAGTVGKTRMQRDGGIRSPYKWRVLALSSGEPTIASLIGEEQKTKRAYAGQLVRALDIPAKRALGMFDKAHPGFDADTFAKELAAAASTYYGTAGPAFVRELIERGVTGERVRKLVAEFVAAALKEVAKSNHGQVARVAERFGLIATAAKLATEFGVVAWPEGQVALDALELFKDWLAARGGAAPAEIEQMIAQVRGFIEKYGDSHFDSLDPPPNNPLTGLEIPWHKVSNRAGYRKGEGEAQLWYVLPEAWRKDVCAGFDPHDVAKALAEKGMLEPGRDGKMSKVETIDGKKRRVYVLKPSIFEE